MRVVPICQTVTGSSLAELRSARDAAAGADLVELRLDGVRDLDVAGALEGRTTPVVVTCRPVWEGGRFDGSEADRRRVLEEAARLGADFVDVEWRAGFDDLVRQRGGRGVVLSLHDFHPPRGDLRDRVHAMAATGAEVLKIAVAAERLTDLLPLVGIGREMGRTDRLVLIAMGEAGLASRVLAARFGSRWTYVGDQEAVGQLPLARLEREFRVREVTAATDVYGIAGRPVRHSVSPAMHNAAFAAAGVDAVYLPLAAADAADFVSFAEGFRIKGASVTAPFKQDVLARLDEMDAISRAVGAVNTVRIAGRHWMGTNTDVAGFLAPLAGRLSLAGARAAVIGAGGAARAAAYALRTAGADVTIYARREAAALDAAGRVGARGAVLPPPPGSWDVLVNATPVGSHLAAGRSPVPGARLDGRLVYDLVYSPARTRLLADAEVAGCETLGGLDMLVEQARLQFGWWTGRAVPAAVLRAAAVARVSSQERECPTEPTR